MSEHEPRNNVDNELLDRIFGTPEDIDLNFQASMQRVSEKYQTLARNRAQSYETPPEPIIDDWSNDESEDA
jgi:hypothetical protein